uniref:PDZ domain-containing protein n=1 Tax=Daphnia galeata TaxID=27404 RepID=A0A8J2WJL3_9CRUS|nr:unnamed protein product [Daphnia galeata]
MSLGSRLTLVVTCLTLVPGPCRAQNDCFTSSSIVGAVLGTFFSTAVALALLVFFLWWIYYRRTPNGADSQTKGARVVESGSGFDNPCFEANPNSDVVDGGKAEEYGQKQDAKSTSWTPLRFFGANKNEKKRSMDDSFISEPERVSVQLRGHDFTGLGFNVTGNMRDGIFIKDISNRGPAFESGKIAQGDRILNVTISFRHIVFEDAMTILSYASPYDVTVELEKGLRNNSSTLKKRKAASTVSLASASTNVTLLTTTGSAQPEGPPNERLIHPLYRSQSIDDLSKVGRADTTVRAGMQIPNLTGQLSGGLAKSKLLGKANVDIDVPNVPDVKIKGVIPKPGSANLVLDAGDISVAPSDASLTVDPSRSSKMPKFAIKVLPDFKFKGNVKSPELGMTKLPTGLYPTPPDAREVELKLPKVEIHTPKASELVVDIDMPDGSGINSSTRNASLAIDMPEQEFSATMPKNISSDVKLNIEAPSLNISAPAGVTEMNLKGPAISQPNIDITLPPTANLDLDLKSPSLSDVEVDHEIPNAVSVDLNKAAKSGFHIKFPKFGGNKTSKVDIPETSVEITAPEIDVALPEASLEVDPKLKKDGSKAGFEFKMPKLSLKKKPEIAVEAKALSSAQAIIPEIDVDAKIPGASIDIQPPVVSVSAPEVELPSASIDVKKSKIGFSMPKFNIGKDNVELKDGLDVNVGIPSGNIEITRQSDDSESDDDSEGGKKKLKFGKMPKISMNKPHFEVEASVLDASAEVEIPSAQVEVGDLENADVKIKNKFGFKIPKFGASGNISGGDLDLDASRELEVKLPSTEIKTETSDSSDDDEDDNGVKKKKRFNIKMPKFGLPKAEMEVNSSNIDVDVPSITTDLPSIKPTEGSLEIGVPNLMGDVLRMQSDSEDSDSKEEGKKRSKSFEVKAPELQLSGGINLPSLALSPIGNVDVKTTGDTDVHFNVKTPSPSFSTPVSSSELKIKVPNIDQPNIDVSLPSTANLDLDLKTPSLPDVPVCADVAIPEVSVDKVSKSGFHIKFPKFGGSKTVKADVPETGVKIAAPEIDVALPEASLEVDPKLKKDGSKAGFEFKMPKLSLKKKPEIAVEAKALSSAQAIIPEIDVDAKIPGASIDIQPPVVSVSAPEVELPSASIDVKKSKIGFSMPKFNMGKGHMEHKEASHIAVDVPSVKTDLPHLTALSDSEESEGGKKKLKFGKMPKISINKPNIQIEASIPDASAEVGHVDVGDLEKADVKIKNKFGFKIPKFGASGNISGGDLDLDASRELEVKLPSAEIKTETSDSSDDDEDDNGIKKKKRFNIKMPKFGLPKAEMEVNSSNIDVDVPSITTDLPSIKPTEGNIEIETPKFDATFPKIGLSSQMDSDSDDENRKRSKGAMGLAIEGSVPDIDANVAINTGNLDLNLKEMKKGPKFGVKFPKLKTDKDSNSESDTTSDEDDVELDKAFRGKIAISSVDLSRPKAELQGSMELPNTELGFDVKQPKLDLEAEIGDDENDDDETKKKSSKFGFSIKMPKFNMKKKNLNADIEDKDVSAHLNLDSISGGTDDDRSSDEKKKGKVSVKLPKFSMKKPDLDVDLGVDQNIEVQADAKMPKANLPEIAVHVKDGGNEMPTFSLPEVSIEKPQIDLHLDSNIEVDGSKKLSIESGKLNVSQLPVGITVEGQMQSPRVPDASLNIATGTNLQADVVFPGIGLEVDHEDLDDEKKKSKFFKMPKFHMGKHHSEIKVDHGPKVNLPEKIDAELNLPTGKLELDPNFRMDFANRDEVESDDDKKDSGKKKTRFGIKMPKFQMKQSQALGMNVDVKPEDVALGVKIPTLEANVDPFALEQDSISSDNTSIEMNLPKLPDLNPVEADLSVSNVKVDVPEKDGKKKGKFSFKSNFKMPKLHMSSGKGHAELEVPSTEMSLPKLEIDPATEIRKSEISIGEIEKGTDVKFGASLSKVDKPSTDFDITFHTNISHPKVSLDVKEDLKTGENDEENQKGEKSKSAAFAFKMPKLNVSPKAELDIPEVKTEVNVKAPKVEGLKLEGNFNLDEADQYKKSPFIVKMPALNPVNPDIQLGVSASKDDSDSDSEEEKTKKGFILGFKLPQLSMPQLSMGGKSESIDSDSSISVKKPELDVSSIDTNMSLPEINIKTKKRGDFETDDTSDSSDSENEKSKKGLKLGFKMPKLSTGGKSDASLDADAVIKMKPPKLDVPSIDPKVSLPEADTNKKKSSFGSHFKIPNFSTKANVTAVGNEIDTSDDESDSEDEKSKKGLKLGFKMPKLSVSGKSDEDNLDVDSSMKIRQPELDVPSIDAEVSLPDVDITTKKKGSFGSHFKMPSFSTKVDISASAEQVDTSDDNSDSESEKSKKGLKLGFKMPKLSMGGKNDCNINTDSSSVKIKQPEQNLASIDAEVSLPEVDVTTKKKSSFGSHFKMPHFSTKADSLTAGDVEQIETSDSDSDSENDKSKKELKLGFKMPQLSMSGKGDVSLGSESIIQVKQPDLDISPIDAKVSLPEAELSTKKKSNFGSNFKMPSFSTKTNVSASGTEQVDASDDSSDSEDEKSKKGLKLGFKMPQLSMGGKNDVNLDSGSTIKIKQPELDVPSIDAEVSLPEAELSTKKKSSFGSHFKMPSFSTKANVSASGAEQVDASDDSSDSEDDKSKKGLKLGFKMPQLSMGGKSDVNLDSGSAIKIKQPELDVPSIDAEVSLPEAELSTKKKSSFGSHFKMPSFSTKANVNVSGEEQVAISDDSNDSEDEKSKKGMKLDFKMPQISTGGKVDVNLDSDSIIEVKKPDLDLPSIDSEISLPEVEVSTKKKAGFGSHFKMPHFSTKANVSASGAEQVETSDDSSDSEDEKSKKGLKLGFKMPQLSMGGKGDVNLDSDSTIKTKHPELDVSSIDADVLLPEVDVSTKKKSSFGSHFKIPSFSTKSNVTISGVEVPDVDIVSPRFQTQEEEHGLSVAGEEDSEKKSHKIGIKLPKFQTRQRNAEVTLPQVELKAENTSDEEDNGKELKIKVKKPKFGIKLPEFNKPKSNPGVNIQSPNLVGNLSSEVNFPRTRIEINQPTAAISLEDTSNVDIQVGNIDAEVAKVKAQLAQLQAEFDIQSGKQQMKIEDDDSSSSSSDNEIDKRSKTSGINFGLKLPKFSLGKEKSEAEPKVDVNMPSLSLTTKNNGDEMTSPILSSLEVEPVKLESAPGNEKEKKKFSLGLKMPKFPSKGSAVVGESDSSSKDFETAVASKSVKVNVKAPKMKLKKKKEDHQSSSSDSESGENNDEEDKHRNKDASGNSQLMGLEVKLPRVQVYKNVEYQEAEKGQHDSSSDEEDEVKDIKKNIGARFGVKLKKPKMFSSNKIEITGKNDSGNNSSSLQPEWKLPRVDLRRASKSSDQELSIEVDLDGISEQQKLEQLSPSERAEAIRRDSKSSAGIRLHSPSYISLMPSPRSKKPTLEMLDVDSSPKLLSVTRLDPTPPIESSVKMQQPLYGNIELTTTMTGPQVSASQVPSSVIMASDAVKLKRGPPTPARRFIVPFEPNSAVLHVAHPVITTDVTVEGGFSTIISDDVSSELEVNIGDPSLTSGNKQQASDTDISITTSTGSDTLVINCSTPSSGQQEAHNRKASSLGDLTRIPTSGSEEGSLERTVSLDFKPVSTLAGNSSRAIYNLAVQDLSRVGEDSDEDYNLNRKRTISDQASLESEVTVVTADEVDAQRLLSSTNIPGGNRTFLSINTDDDGGNVTLRPIGGDIAESLWFGSTSIQTVESVQTTMSYTQMEESISTDVTLTTTSLGTSPSETSSSSGGSPFSPASPEPSGESTPNLIEHSSQVENGRNQQFHTEITELAQGELGFSDTHTITLEMTSLSDDSQPQPLTDLNPSAGNFAAVRNRFEQLSGSNPINGGETTGSLGRNSGRMSQTQGTVIKRLSGNFEDLPASSVNVVQKSFMQHLAPELSEGALSRTVIISSLTLDRAEQNNVSSTTGIGPESPVPNLEPPC